MEKRERRRETETRRDGEKRCGARVKKKQRFGSNSHQHAVPGGRRRKGRIRRQGKEGREEGEKSGAKGRKERSTPSAITTKHTVSAMFSAVVPETINDFLMHYKRSVDRASPGKLDRIQVPLQMHTTRRKNMHVHRRHLNQ